MLSEPFFRLLSRNLIHLIVLLVQVPEHVNLQEGEISKLSTMYELSL